MVYATEHQMRCTHPFICIYSSLEVAIAAIAQDFRRSLHYRAVSRVHATHCCHATYTLSLFIFGSASTSCLPTSYL